MNAKPHRQNSRFQLRHFLAGSCTTPDGAYVLLYGQLNDMQTKLAHAESQLKRRQSKLLAAEAKEAKAQVVIDAHKNNSGSGLLHDVLQAEADLLDAQAERLEIAADVPTWEMNLTAAKQELADIENLMLEIKPQCKYAEHDILTMSELAQEEEWLGELKQRAENFLLTAGTIPHDHFQTMRMHPRFKEELVPHIQLMYNKISLIGQKDFKGNLIGPASHAEVMLELDVTPLKLEA
jgi:hypothetical protein